MEKSLHEHTHSHPDKGDKEGKKKKHTHIHFHNEEDKCLSSHAHFTSSLVKELPEDDDD